jgi:hypothetical protein
VPVYARDVQARVCKPPVIAAQARLLPSTQRLVDTSRVPVASVQLKLRDTVFYRNGSILQDVASVVVHARESDIWDISGGDATAFSLPAAPVSSSSPASNYPSIPQLRRRGRFLTASHLAYTADYSVDEVSALQLLWLPTDRAILQLLGSAYPLTMQNAEALGNWTARWAFLNFDTPDNVTKSLAYSYNGTAACDLMDSIGIQYTSMTVATAPSMIASGYNNMAFSMAHVAAKNTSALPTLQAANAGAGLGCGLTWRRRAPQAMACTMKVRGIPSGPYSRYYVSVAAAGATIEEDAVIGCASGVELPVALTDASIPRPEDDVGELVFDRVGRQFSLSTAYPWATGNLCMSGGACLYSIEGQVQTVMVIVSAAPEQEVATYVSTQQGGMSVFSQAAGVFGILWAAAKYVKSALLAVGGLRRKRFLTAE